MITAFLMWALDVQIPDWMIPVAGVVAITAIVAAVVTDRR